MFKHVRFNQINKFWVCNLEKKGQIVTLCILSLISIDFLKGWEEKMFSIFRLQCCGEVGLSLVTNEVIWTFLTAAC